MRGRRTVRRRSRGATLRRPFSRSCALDRRQIERRRQVFNDGVEHELHAFVFERRTAQNRNDRVRDDRFAKRPLQVVESRSLCHRDTPTSPSSSFSAIFSMRSWRAFSTSAFISSGIGISMIFSPCSPSKLYALFSSKRDDAFEIGLPCRSAAGSESRSASGGQ